MIGCIIKEIELKADQWSGVQFQTIYIGGGTPSLLSQSDLASIFNALYQHFDIHPNLECTLEANPDDIHADLLTSYAQTGINRISLGLQTLDDDLLESMNRAHNENMALNALNLIRDSEIDQISCDLIFGIAGQTDELLNNDIDILLSHEVDHISAYALTVEEKTALHTLIKTGKVRDVSQNDQSRQFYLLDTQFTKAGFDHYEVSNYALNQNFAKHNTSYWQGKPYLGLGPSAHSFRDNRRSWNIANNAKYMQSIIQSTIPNNFESLSESDRYNEVVMTGLRTKWGVGKNDIDKYSAELRDHFSTCSQPLIFNGELIEDNEKYTIPLAKWIYADRISSDLFWT